MRPLPDLADTLQLQRLIPSQYAVYLPLLERALAFFLERLPRSRQAGILAAQAGLPLDAPAEERLVVLLERCPTLHKLGQVVARDRRLSPELRVRLQRLESMAASAEVDTKALQRELAAGEDIEIGPWPIAQASVAIVLPMAWWPRPEERRRGVVKQLKPGIEERLEQELVIWSTLGPFLAEQSRKLGLPPLDYADTLDSVVRLLRNEVRLDVEQANLEAARQFYAGRPEVLIPAVYPFSTPRATVMERVDGVKVSDAVMPRLERDRTAALLAEALLARPFWTTDAQVPIHADPHAGNLFVTDDRRLAILDWSLAIRLTKAQRESVLQVVLGGVTLDEGRTCRALRALLRRPPLEPLLRIAVAHALREVRQGTMPGFDWLTRLLDRLALDGAAFPEELTLFRKSLLTLAGVLADVAPSPSVDASVDAALVSVGLQQFLRELPQRSFASPTSRAFATHLSAADVLGLWSAIPAAMGRLQLGVLRDGLAAFHAP